MTLSAVDDANLGAFVFDRASRTPWRHGLANGLPESNQRRIVVYPMATRQNFAQRHFGFIRGLARDQAPSIRDSMHVGIDADSGFAERFGHHQVRGLAPDSIERKQLIDIIGNASAEFCD